MKLTNHPINISSNIVDNVTKARTQNPTYSPDGKYLAYQYVLDLSTTAFSSLSLPWLSARHY